MNAVIINAFAPYGWVIGGSIGLAHINANA